MNNNQVVIQLNASALKSVIEMCGGDEFILHLKKATMENVLRGRSKALIDNTLEEALKGQIAFEVKQLVGEVKSSSWSKQVTLQPDFLIEVQGRARTAITMAMEEMKNTIPAQVEAHVKGYVPVINKYVDDLVKVSFKKEVDAAVKAKIEAALKGC